MRTTILEGPIYTEVCSLRTEECRCGFASRPSSASSSPWIPALQLTRAVRCLPVVQDLASALDLTLYPNAKQLSSETLFLKLTSDLHAKDFFTDVNGLHMIRRANPGFFPDFLPPKKQKFERSALRGQILPGLLGSLCGRRTSSSESPHRTAHRRFFDKRRHS